jgi:polar amino acid transport system substrate-binding protein
MMSTGDLIALLAERGIAGINLGAIILWPETILMPQDAPQEVIDQLTKDGVLRAGINMANGLLVTGKAANGDPQGVSPDLARAIAERLSAGVSYVPFASPGELADAAAAGLWDIGLIAAEPSRAETIAFTAAYVEIEATYLVPAGSPIQSVDQVDREGLRIAVSGRSAYDLYLTRSLEHAELSRARGADATFELFTVGNFDALAGLRPGLIGVAAKLQGSRILDGYFTTVQQAIGTPIGNQAGAEFLAAFAEDAKASGFVKELIDKHGVTGRLSVAPAA